MGSLAAVLFRSDPPDEARVRSMLLAAPHRGSSLTLSRVGRVVLGISDHVDRPEGDLAEGSGLAVAFTGSLDNAEPLARELLPADGRAPELSPASVVLAGFARQGEAMIPRLRGVYAVVITDGERMWAFRDHIGFRTLFHRDEARSFYLATEAKQVVAGAGIAKEPDVDVLGAIFFREYDDDTPAALRGVRRLPKATIVRADDGRTAVRRYWDPASLIETADYGDDELLERFEALMTQATGRALVGNDVVSLSGGIDSPAIAAFAAPQHLERFQAPLSALSALYPDQPSVDESTYVVEIAQAMGMPLHTYDRQAQPLSRLREWTELVDGPIPRLLLSDAEEHFTYAKKYGFRTMLTGEIAEFLVDMRRFLPAHLLRHGRFGPLFDHVRAQRSQGVRTVGIGRQLGVALVPRAAQVLYVSVRPLPPGARPPSWMDERRFNRSSTEFAVPASERWRHQQLLGFFGPGLPLEAAEVAEDASGVRLRRPWADVDLWEFFLSLRAETKYPTVQRKGLVRRLLRGRVPDVILDRQDKTVFDESIAARIDHAELGRWLIDPPQRIPGVDYEELAELLRAERLDAAGYQWARDLAQIHAFLSLWER
jgi:asparagine synthase (glutamine-hydrolysing)